MCNFIQCPWICLGTILLPQYSVHMSSVGFISAKALQQRDASLHKASCHSRIIICLLIVLACNGPLGFIWNVAGRGEKVRDQTPYLSDFTRLFLTIICSYFFLLFNTKWLHWIFFVDLVFCSSSQKVILHNYIDMVERATWKSMKLTAEIQNVAASTWHFAI